MLKKILTTSLITATLIFSGCGESDGESALETTIMLDNGNFSGVIAKLEGNTQSDEDRLHLASAYMGQAGFSFGDLISMIASEDDTSFAIFANSVDDKKDANTLDYLKKAIDNYSAITGVEEQNRAPSRATSNISSLEDIKLFLGLAYTVKATTAMSYLGDLSALVEAGDDDVELLASSCASVFIYGGKQSDGTVTSDCSDARVLPQTTINEKKYGQVEVTLTDGRGSFRRLLTEDNKGVVLSDGYIDSSDKRTANANYGQNRAYPVKDETVTIKNTLIDTLNDGFDTIIDVAPDDIKGDIEDFKAEIDPGLDGISEIDFANYVAKEMAKQ